MTISSYYSEALPPVVLAAVRGRQASWLCALTLTVVAAGCGRTAPYEQPASSEIASAIRTALNDAAGGETSAEPVVVADPTGFATLKGRFRLNGSPPAMRPLAVKGDDAAICAPGGKAALSREVVVGADNGLANVLLYVTSDVPAAWLHETDAASANATVEFDQKACVFLSRVFALRSTQTLKILNSDPIAHNTNISPKQRATPFNQTIPAGTSVEHLLGGEERAPFPVTCSIHPWMSAWMITRGNPYFAVTDKDGFFEIPRVPAGVELELRVWHERTGYVESVTRDDVAVKWPKGRMSITLENDATVDMNVSVDAGLFN